MKTKLPLSNTSIKQTDVIQYYIDLCLHCAEICTANSNSCRQVGLEYCAQLSDECAAACNRVLCDGFVNMDVFKNCADACNACTTECDLHDTPYCSQCADICNECEEACVNIAKQYSLFNELINR